MKRKLLLLCGLFSFFAFETVTAQEYEYLEITSGLNEDVIANGANTAAASTTSIVDNDSFAFVAADFQPTGSSIPPSYGLPVNGNIASAATPGLSYQLADYSENNSLRIHGTTPVPALTTGTLVFSNQVTAKKLYVLATSGSGSSTMSVVINFSDATSQTVTGSVIPDWFNSNVLPIAASGFGRVGVGSNTVENPSGNPRMYQLLINIDAENQVKEIESIQFTKTSTAQGVANIFAVTAEVLGSCPSPEGLTATSGITTGAVTWTEPVIVPGDGYDYYFTTTTDAPTESTEPTGNVASDVNTIDFSELEIGETYYFWVRSNCGAGDAGPWVMATFTTGQISNTYTDGVIETLYNTSPTIASTTSCPGVMTVSIPDGYQISDLATSYIMTTASNGYKSEQRSFLVCTTTNTSESSLYSGTGNGGTQQYNRTGLSFANGATGDVEFELRAWRTYGSSGCTTTHNFVENNSWTVTVTYECVTPLTPQATNQTLCTGNTVADLMADTDYEDATLRWYDVEEGGEPLAGETELTEGTYYVSQHRYTCESERQAVVVTLSEPILPTTEVTQSFCSGAVVSNLFVESAEEGIISWYATNDSPEVLGEEAMLETGSYFVSQTIYGGCESERIEVAVTVNTIAVPTTSALTACAGSQIGGLTIEGEENATFNWYATSDGEEPLNEETTVEAGSYFVSQTVEGCESERTEVSVTVNAIPEAPEGDAIQEFDAGDTVATLTVSVDESAVVNWYVMNDDEELVSVDATTVLVDGETYYVTQTLGNCESETLAITANEILNTVVFETSSLKVYPNPANAIITVTNNTAIESIEIANLLGQKVLSQKANTESTQVDVSGLAAGTYILNVQLQNGTTTSVKVVKY